MSSKRIISVLEFGQGNIKLLVGERIDENIYIYQAYCEPCNAIKGGKIINEEQVLEVLNKIKNNVKKRFEFDLTKVFFALPSYDLKIYKKQVSGPTHNEYTVSELDIEGVRSNCRKFNPGDNRVIIEVIPTEYYLADDSKFLNPPIGKKSDKITLTCSLITVPSETLTAYRSLLIKAGIDIKNYYLRDIASFETYKNDVEKDNVLQIDIGHTSTSCSIFLNKKLASTFEIALGSDYLTKKISEELNLSYQEAEELKIKFGVVHLEKENNSIIYRKKDGKLLTINMLAKVLDKGIEEIFLNIEKEAKDFITLGDYEISLIGGGSHLINLEKKATEYFLKTAKTYKPKLLGVNNSSFMALCGLLELSKYDNDELDAYSTKGNVFSTLEEELNIDRTIEDSEKKTTKYLGSIYNSDEFK